MFDMYATYEWILDVMRCCFLCGVQASRPKFAQTGFLFMPESRGVKSQFIQKEGKNDW